MKKTTVLLLDADPRSRTAVEAILATAPKQAFEVMSCSSMADARAAAEQEEVDVVIVAPTGPSTNLVESVRQATQTASHLPVIALTSAKHWRQGPEAIRAGAEDFLLRERLNLETLERVIAYAIARKHHETKLLQSEQFAAVFLLARGVAHQFNNINATIFGYADLVLNDPRLPDSQRERLERIRDGADRATRLARQLMRVTGLGSREPAPADLSKLVREVLDLLEIPLQAYEIALEAELPPQPLTHLDSRAISIAVLNIIVNAIQSLLGRDVRRLRVRTGTSDKTVFVEIEDTGHGMSAEDLPRIFCPFFTRKGEFANQESQSEVRGTGLGLSSAYNSVRLHGGRIHVESTPGQGSTFRVALPIVSD